jgi:hypothetical protein
VRAAAEHIASLLRRTDVELERAIGESGAAIDPKALGLSTRDWVLEIRADLVSYLLKLDNHEP